MTREDYIQAEELILGSRISSDEERFSDKSLKEAMNLFKKHFIRSALQAHGWQQTRTAQALGVQRTYLSKLIKDLNIEK